MIFMRGKFESMCKLRFRVVVVWWLRYFYQGDGRLLGEVEAPYSSEIVREHVTELLGFWDGSRAPLKVPLGERWKCSFCRYAAVCHS